MPILVQTGYVAGSEVDLGTVWLNLASDLTDLVAFVTMSDLKVTSTQPGEVRTAASGRRRVITTPGRVQAADLSVFGSSRDAIQWLESHVGDLMCVRDDRGRKLYGVYFDVEVTEWLAHPELGNVSLSLTSVTHSEQV